MEANIFEIKCPIDNPEQKHHILMNLNAQFIGTDHQIDTYFQVSEGRLKLRQGTIEHTLIRYHRPETKDLKNSKVLFEKFESARPGLLNILTDTLGIWKIVDKHRRIYFIDNVKFHIDKVTGLGDFMEIEAIDTEGSRTSEQLAEQCRKYIQLLGLDERLFIDQSYSDMVPSITA